MDTFIVLRGWRDAMETQGRLSAKTQRTYLRVVIGFLIEVMVPVDEVTPAMIQDKVRELADKPAQRNALLMALKSLYRYAGKAHGIADPTEDFVVVHQRPKGPPEYLAREEIDRLLEAAEEVDPRCAPTLALMYGTAARVHSITELRPTDIDVQLRTVRFELGVKNDVPYALPLGTRAFAAALRLLELKDYRPKYGKHRAGKLVGVGDEQVRQWMKKAGRLAGIGRRMYPHLLRHSALTHLANDPEVSVAVVVAAAGWSSPDPYKHYITARPGPLKAALGKL